MHVTSRNFWGVIDIIVSSTPIIVFGDLFPRDRRPWQGIAGVSGSIVTTKYTVGYVEWVDSVLHSLGLHCAYCSDSVNLILVSSFFGSLQHRHFKAVIRVIWERRSYVFSTEFKQGERRSHAFPLEMTPSSLINSYIYNTHVARPIHTECIFSLLDYVTAWNHS